MFKIKKNDEVIVLAGKDKGKRGKVLKIFPAKKRLLVEGVSLIKKHVKPNPQTNTSGGIVTREASIDISNVAIFNPMTNKADRVGFKFLESGKKVRFYKSNNEVIDI